MGIEAIRFQAFQGSGQLASLAQSKSTQKDEPARPSFAGNFLNTQGFYTTQPNKTIGIG